MVFSILGFVLCFIFGVVAWIMGSGDLKLMDAGLMDPSGRGITSAGRILGIIATFLNLLIMIGLGILLAVVLAAAASMASQGAGGP